MVSVMPSSNCMVNLRYAEGTLVTLDSHLQARLPNELLILIASYTHRKRDLASLCLVSRIFRNIATPILYRVVEIIEPKDSTGTDVARHFSLYRTLRDRRFSQFVIEIYCRLEGQKICAKHVHPTTKGRPSRCCSCNDYDLALGGTLLCLSNLQVLDLQCRLCRWSHFHPYLYDLQLPKLKELRFTCRGSSRVNRPFEEPKSLFSTPYMRGVIALALDCDYSWLDGAATEHEPFRLDVDTLSNLRTLDHNGHTSCNRLLMARPIERMCVEQASWQKTPLLHDGIRLSPGKLSHLFMADILPWLPGAMRSDLEPYRHLRYIGRIVFSGTQVFDSHLGSLLTRRRLMTCQEATVLSEMSLFNLLSGLEMVEIEQRFRSIMSGGALIPRAFSPTRSFLDLLRVQHPALRWVLLTGDQYLTRWSPVPIQTVLWERKDKWERRVVLNPGHWKILNGGLDHL